ARLDIECLVDRHAVDLDLEAIALADHVHPRPLAKLAFDVLLAAEIDGVGPVFIAAPPIDPAAAERHALAALLPHPLAIAIFGDFGCQRHRQRLAGLRIFAGQHEDVTDAAFDD